MHMLDIRQRRAAIAVIALAAGAAAAPALAQQQPHGRPQVLVLGTYHFANPGLDYANPRADDHLSPKRQREIEELVARLAAFRPTKIALEVPVARDSALNARYQRYLRGEDTLRVDEGDQIGLRLARRLGHQRVYAVDYRLDLDFGGVMKYAAEHGLARLVQEAQAWIQRYMASFDSLQKTSTVGEILLEANSAAADSTHGLYLELLAVRSDTGYVGAEMVSDWYERNLKILSNVRALVERPDERVLVIIGSGHGPLLREFVRQSPGLELADLRKFLGAPGRGRAAPR
ncbi:MAG TPA: DUF5694 domain-containing protein [Gemmatimonadaceae bacterium]|nr:DUF5694 domain-containing protein [Gemmatimonadaceae bacterium]